VRLDELLGDGFAVIGFDSAAFRAAALRLLPPGMQGCVLPLVRRDDDFLGGHPEDALQPARDVSGELGAMLDHRGAVAVVVRPDRYGYRFVAEAELHDPAAAPAPVEAASPLARAPARMARQH
jgi:3-(3-hydroxy-phenyl)propionate hydroxylase